MAPRQLIFSENLRSALYESTGLFSYKSQINIRKSLRIKKSVYTFVLGFTIK